VNCSLQCSIKVCWGCRESLQPPTRHFIIMYCFVFCSLHKTVGIGITQHSLHYIILYYMGAYARALIFRRKQLCNIDFKPEWGFLKAFGFNVFVFICVLWFWLSICEAASWREYRSIVYPCESRGEVFRDLNVASNKKLYEYIVSNVDFIIIYSLISLWERKWLTKLI